MSSYTGCSKLMDHRCSCNERKYDKDYYGSLRASSMPYVVSAQYYTKSSSWQIYSDIWHCVRQGRTIMNEHNDFFEVVHVLIYWTQCNFSQPTNNSRVPHTRIANMKLNIKWRQWPFDVSIPITNRIIIIHATKALQ